MLLSQAVSSLRQRRFAKNVAVLSGGTIVGQAIAVLASPIITRLYSPSEYGVLGVYMSALALASVAAMLRYEVAIPVGETNREAANVCGLSMLLAVVTSVLSGVAVLLLGRSLFRSFASESVTAMAWLLPLGMLASAVYQCLSFWAVRKQDYRSLAHTKLTQSAGMVVAQIVLGGFGGGAVGLMIGHMIGRAGGVGMLARQVMKNDRAHIAEIDRDGMRAAAVKYRQFPQFSLPAAFLDTAIANLPILLIANLFGIQVAGWFTLVQRVLFVPAGLLTASVSQVYLGEIAEVKRSRPEALPGIFLRRCKQMAMVGAALTVVVVLAVVQLVPFVFGEKWKNAAVCGAILSPLLLASVVASPFGCTLDVLRRQDMHLARDVIRALLMIAGVMLMYILHTSWQVGMMFLSGTGTLGYIIYWYLSWRAIRTFSGRAGESTDAGNLAAATTASQTAS